MKQNPHNNIDIIDSPVSHAEFGIADTGISNAQTLFIINFSK